MALKFSCVSDSLQNWPPKFLKKRNLTAIPPILTFGVDQKYGLMITDTLVFQVKKGQVKCR